jgi:hypothetical protein
MQATMEGEARRFARTVIHLSDAAYLEVWLVVRFNVFVAKAHVASAVETLFDGRATIVPGNVRTLVTDSRRC